MERKKVTSSFTFYHAEAIVYSALAASKQCGHFHALLEEPHVVPVS